LLWSSQCYSSRVNTDSFPVFFWDKIKLTFYSEYLVYRYKCWRKYVSSIFQSINDHVGKILVLKIISGSICSGLSRSRRCSSRTIRLAYLFWCIVPRHCSSCSLEVSGRKTVKSVSERIGRWR
jgi:hypothetical protein